MHLQYIIGILAILPAGFAAPVPVKGHTTATDQDAQHKKIPGMIFFYSDDTTATKRNDQQDGKVVSEIGNEDYMADWTVFKQDAKRPSMASAYKVDLTAAGDKRDPYQPPVGNMIFHYNNDLSSRKQDSGH